MPICYAYPLFIFSLKKSHTITDMQRHNFIYDSIITNLLYSFYTNFTSFIDTHDLAEPLRPIKRLLFDEIDK